VGKGLITLLLLLAVAFPAAAQDPRTYLPPGAQLFAPHLVGAQKAGWPQMPEPWTLGGLVEQESCISLKHPKCWNPHAELKTSREYGFGLGQITVAYQADGRERFNKFTELKQTHAALADWAWPDRYDAGHQLRAIVEMTHDLWRRLPPAATVGDHLSFMLASYNGGVAATLQDRVLCSHTPGCDPTRWAGNVAAHSIKSRVPQQKYGGQSWFSINRNYVRYIMYIRRDKYKVFWGS
jgi:hypothetical protein